MRAFDFQRATIDRISEIFRKATVGGDGKERKRGGQRRVLLADEVGLGKTIVARGVIERVRQMREEVGDDCFRVVYICSNVNIARQNISKLGISDSLDVSTSRLSMQHLILAQKFEAKADGASAEMREPMRSVIIPLTPATSFHIGGRMTGTKEERALIYTILRHHERLKDVGKDLSCFLHRKKSNVSDGSWAYQCSQYEDKVSALGERYIADLNAALDRSHGFRQTVEDLRRSIDDYRLSGQTSEEYPDQLQIINRLRCHFAMISVARLQPDLVIMVEFQRFSQLIDLPKNSYEDTEEDMLIRKFFCAGGEEQTPMVLLLSATPYKPYTTNQEIAESHKDTHKHDFDVLMEFLYERSEGFQEIWAGHSNALLHLQSKPFDVVVAAKRRAEDALYRAMCRTERLSEDIIDTQTWRRVLPLSQEDLESYIDMERVVERCREKGIGRGARLYLPVEYVKSCPYLLSMMSHYQLKRKISEIVGRYPEEFNPLSERLLLDGREVRAFKKILPRNARLQFLIDEVMLPKRRDAHKLLWVPASKPYYRVDAGSPFAKNRDFSKVLLFSGWEIVPRMASVMLSYEVERRLTRRGGVGEHQSDRISQRLKKMSSGSDNFSMLLVCHPSRYLAGIFQSSLRDGDTLEALRSRLTERIEGDIAKIAAGRDIERNSRAGAEQLYRLLRRLEGAPEAGSESDSDTESWPTSIHPLASEILAYMAIGSPGVCLRRSLTKIYPELSDSIIEEYAVKMASGFVRLFNQGMAMKVIDSMKFPQLRLSMYLARVFAYCAEGNLQSVIDEYLHLLASESADIAVLAEDFGKVFLGETTLDIECRDAEKISMSILYGRPFVKTKSSASNQAVAHIDDVRRAFQSPFFPFLLSTTSVGQEGLDFHWYCRRVMHWNLPTNPQDLEQREGRVNRYKCLAIRRNVAHLTPPGMHDWEEMFELMRRRVKSEFGDRYSEMVPYWCLPPEWLQSAAAMASVTEGIERIDRIVAQYPCSYEIPGYDTLVGRLTDYRLMMGQPRQEDLLRYIDSLGLDEDRLRALLFDLSPDSRQRRQISQLRERSQRRGCGVRGVSRRKWRGRRPSQSRRRGHSRRY